MDNSWIILLVIFTSTTSHATMQQHQNCSKILCPGRQSECTSLDQISKCSEYSMILPDITDVPIYMEYDEFSGRFVLNAFGEYDDYNITFEKAAPLWSKLGNVNIALLSISSFCDAQNLRRDYEDKYFKISCGAIDPRFQTINIDYFATMNTVQKMVFSFNCAQDFIGNLNEKFPEIVEVFLDNNVLVTVPTMLKNTTTIRSLSLTMNNIHTLKNDDFEGNILLRELLLDVNCLQHLPSGLLSRLSHLEILSFSHNYLETLPELLLSNNTNLRTFIAVYNNLKTLPSKLFYNTAKVKEISLNNNQLSSIPEDLLKNCDQLEKIYLNDNQLFTLPLYAFRSTANLKYLHLYRNNFTEIPIIKFGRFSIGGPPSIDLSFNNINIIHGPIINRIPQVNNLTLTNNSITFVPQNKSLLPLPSGHAIMVVECEYCSIDEIHPEMFYGVQAVLSLRGNNVVKLDMSDLKYLSKFDGVDLSQNEIRTINTTLDYRMTQSRFIETVRKKINLSGNPVVCDCDLLNFMIFVSNITGDVINRSILTFDVSDLQCHSPASVVGQYVLDLSFDQFITEYFEDCPKDCSCHLVCFNLSISVNCNDGDLRKFPTTYPSILPKLTLNLTNNQITELPSKHDSLWHRVTVLILKNNELRSLRNISSTSTITHLNIQNNKLTNFEPELINLLTTSNNNTKVISFSGNPWLCNCDLKQQYDIILNTKHVIITDEKQLNCTFNGIVYKFTEFDEYCFANTSILTSLFACLTVITALACVSSILFFKYKLQIKYFLFTKHLCMWWVSEEDIDADKQYDAFVSYSSLDGEWVNQHLVNGLENEYPNYRLCLHERDWPGGSLIVDQIVRSVENSRRTIIVLTDNFVVSDWGLTEFTVAYQRAIEDNIKRIVVVVPFDLPDLDKCSEEFRSFVKLTTYIEANKPHFWRKLRCSLPRRNNAVKEDVDARVV